MLPRFLLDSDDDWQEKTRRSLYPWLHPRLQRLGDLIGVPMYAMGGVGHNQYVGKLDEGEEAIEIDLVDLGFRRNPIACLKSLPDGRVSEGSWALVHEDAPEVIEPGMQLHVTMFERDDGQPGREIYAHYEDDWRTSPLTHLREKNFSVLKGVEIAREYLDSESFLVLKQ
ncbi:hypothetical protein HRTV-2_gp39 [Halorubrum virus HRTV-2]|nr:hypothetical protein HRTV-2_gp39 [Halorubrum virus HRTV-2]